MSDDRVLTVTAERDDHTCETTLRVRDYYSSDGVWVRCRTCGGIHHATVDNA